MKYRLAELLDIPRLQRALDGLCVYSKIPMAIVDVDGTIHAGSPIIHRSSHGPVGAAAPILVEGEHLGNVFAGQPFLEEPDPGSFRARAMPYGRDEETCIDEARKVPIVPEQTVRENLAFVAQVAGMLAETGLRHRRETEAGRERAEEELREKTRLYQVILDNMPCVTLLLRPHSREIVASNRAGLDAGAAPGTTCFGTWGQRTEPCPWCLAPGVWAGGEAQHLIVESGGLTWDAHWIPVGPDLYMHYAFDITERRRLEQSLRSSEEHYRSLFENMVEGYAYCQMIYDGGRPVDFIYVAVNQAFGSLTGLNDVAGKRVSEVIPGLRESNPQLFEIYGRVALTGRPERFEIFVEALGHWFSVSVFSPKREYFVAVFDVITERLNLEQQLRQSQKMEAVGRLAGGVAHDFNNLLTAIIGNVSMALMKLPPPDPVAGMLAEANKAADRAAALTRQLLAFSRKQIIEPKTVSLNDLIGDLHGMLVRLIREDIEIRHVPGDDLGSVRVDVSQFQQVLVNLVVNARDAMPNGGRIDIETSNVELDGGYCSTHPYAEPGRFVMLAVSDTGCGMTEEVRAHLFEPFFTTKSKGSGTGLGLATTYGTVKQAGGFIEVCSEVGKGTKFRIYLPRVGGEASKPAREDASPALPGGTETVLLVEDEDVVREMCVRVLENLGYKVLHASRGREAIALSEGLRERIDLLITDVVMPGMNGGELATQLVLYHPEMRVLFTSGYTEDVIVHHGVLDDDVSFIGKPYSLSALAKKIRQVLDTTE